MEKTLDKDFRDHFVSASLENILCSNFSDRATRQLVMSFEIAFYTPDPKDCGALATTAYAGGLSLQ